MERGRPVRNRERVIGAGERSEPVLELTDPWPHAPPARGERLPRSLEELRVDAEIREWNPPLRCRRHPRERPLVIEISVTTLMTSREDRRTGGLVMGELGVKAVILAGGRGRRLEPYTSVLPKPLMPVGDRAIIEIIVDRLVESGVDDVTL